MPTYTSLLKHTYFDTMDNHKRDIDTDLDASHFSSPSLSPSTPPTLPFIAILPLTALGLVALLLVFYCLYTFCPRVIQDEIVLMKIRLLKRLPEMPEIVVTSPSWTVGAGCGGRGHMQEVLVGGKLGRGRVVRSWRVWALVRGREILEDAASRCVEIWMRLRGISECVVQESDVSMRTSAREGLAIRFSDTDSVMRIALGEEEGPCSSFYPEGTMNSASESKPKMTYGEILYNLESAHFTPTVNESSHLTVPPRTRPSTRY